MVGYGIARWGKVWSGGVPLPLFLKVFISVRDLSDIA